MPPFINYTWFSFKKLPKIDGMFHTNKFIMDTLMLAEL